ncbi:MAG: nucleotidyltransferase family protein [Gemmatimonadota bacterium]
MGGLTKAVILAAGRGTRMRAAAASVDLDAAQESAARLGLKPLIPFGGQPFIRYVLTALADAGYGEVCFVVRPGADPIRTHFEECPVTRLALYFAEQSEPLGAAHAVLAAEEFAGGDDVAVINADNYYPAGALRALREVGGNAMIGCRRGALLEGNITEDRIAGYALVTTDTEGMLTSIVEKPTAGEVRRRGADALISMTCWRFTPSIFDACRAVEPSPRGELELPDAVRRLRVRVVPMDATVLDLSRRDDIPRVGRLLASHRVDL